MVGVFAEFHRAMPVGRVHAATGRVYLGRPPTPKPLAEINTDISALLTRALRKRAEHHRVIFIDVNVPPERPALELIERVGE